MDFNLKPSLTATVETIVTEEDTAKRFGSGGVNVYATPMMVGLMENAALKAVDPHLPKGYTTVGTRLEINHIAATPVGLKVWAKAVLTKVEGKRLVFSVEAFDQKEKIGDGLHERYIVNLENFTQRALAKK
ncbi:MAG: thioesterase family protein [Mahellales bacterium]|jgi:fluoroacetyl-CoA thioesterase